MSLRDAPREPKSLGGVWGREAYVHEGGLGGLADRRTHGHGVGGVFDAACILFNAIFDDLEENGRCPAVRKGGKKTRLQNRLQRVPLRARHHRR